MAVEKENNEIIKLLLSNNKIYANIPYIKFLFYIKFKIISFNNNSDGDYKHKSNGNLTSLTSSKSNTKTNLSHTQSILSKSKINDDGNSGKITIHKNSKITSFDFSSQNLNVKWQSKNLPNAANNTQKDKQQFAFSYYT